MKSSKTSPISLSLPFIETQPVTTFFEQMRMFLHAEGRGERASQNAFAQRVVFYLIRKWWDSRYNHQAYPLRTCFVSVVEQPLPPRVTKTLDLLEQHCLRSEMLQASYLMGMLYTSLLSEETRTAMGAYFTPPNLTARLLGQVEAAGIHWSTARVLDPACGGGAFLAPAALKILSQLDEQNATSMLTHLESHLQGFEIDPFSAWMSQVFLDAVAGKYCLAAGRPLKVMVRITNSLEIDCVAPLYDLVIGNPPYGKVTLKAPMRKKFSDSLYGHANLYGLFLHQSFLWTQPGGLIAFLTPTGFMAGEYFKQLRRFILSHGTPVQIDFIHSRKDVFEGVLQETVLATYRRGPTKANRVAVHEIHTPSIQRFETVALGQFALPAEPGVPWILPRRKEHKLIAEVLPTLISSLSKWGYTVKTGPLVWNRKKAQLTQKRLRNTFPLIWAESVSASGRFTWKADLRQHQLYFQCLEEDDYLITDQPCVLLQRTTAKEQERRLIAAVLPMTFIETHGGAVIENHLNIIVPITKRPSVTLTVLAAFLNSGYADLIFRCISGSVAVSAYELENMPLPAPDTVMQLYQQAGRKSKAMVFSTFMPEKDAR